MWGMSDLDVIAETGAAIQQPWTRGNNAAYVAHTVTFHTSGCIQELKLSIENLEITI